MSHLYSNFLISSGSQFLTWKMGRLSLTSRDFVCVCVCVYEKEICYCVKYFIVPSTWWWVNNKMLPNITVCFVIIIIRNIIFQSHDAPFKWSHHNLWGIKYFPIWNIDSFTAFVLQGTEGLLFHKGATVQICMWGHTSTHLLAELCLKAFWWQVIRFWIDFGS